jgi:hypothetical protein
MNTYNKGTKKGQPFIGASNRLYGTLEEPLPRSTPQEIVDSDAVGYGSEPTVGLQAQEFRLRHKRASFLVSRRLGKAPSIYILDRVPALLRIRPFSVGRCALLRSRQKKYVTAYFSVLSRASK